MSQQIYRKESLLVLIWEPIVMKHDHQQLRLRFGAIHHHSVMPLNKFRAALV